MPFFKKSKLELTGINVQLFYPDVRGNLNLPAGLDNENQGKRLDNMSKLIETQDIIPYNYHNSFQPPIYWLRLFQVINNGTVENAIKCFTDIPETDEILSALLLAHSEVYIFQLIEYSVKARDTNPFSITGDLSITPETFEILIRDIYTSMKLQSKQLFSFGLPTHHAHFNGGAGFCLLNKTAVLMAHLYQKSAQPIKFIVIGTDVNRDDGLCDILMNYFPEQLDCCHIDIAASDVYPHHSATFIESQLKLNPKTIQFNNKRSSCALFQAMDKYYYHVDLKKVTRKDLGRHPALIFALKKVSEEITKAIQTKKKLAIFLPTGWDSHQSETAACAKWLDNTKWMDHKVVHRLRFDDDDIASFYKELFHLIQKNDDHVVKLYWGLEGGYEPKVYENQVLQLLKSIQACSPETARNPSMHN